MRASFKEFQGPVRRFLDEVSDQTEVLYTVVEEVAAPLPWHRERVLLIGDAAHASTPFASRRLRHARSRTTRVGKRPGLPYPSGEAAGTLWRRLGAGEDGYCIGTPRRPILSFGGSCYTGSGYRRTATPRRPTRACPETSSLHPSVGSVESLVSPSHRRLSWRNVDGCAVCRRTVQPGRHALCGARLQGRGDDASSAPCWRHSPASSWRLQESIHRGRVRQLGRHTRR
jgi:hypothetical protein